MLSAALTHQYYSVIETDLLIVIKVENSNESNRFYS